MLRILAFILSSLVPSVTLAHTGSHEIGGFAQGILHPVLGFDHLLAMVSVGIVSAQIGGRAIWQVPLAFVTMMVVGGITGIMGIPIPLFSVELGIAFSVFVLGIAIASTRKLPVPVTMLFVGFFAIFHGHAHGIEMPEIELPVLYVFGFVTGTALLHVTGVGIGLVSRRVNQGAYLLRHVGSGIAGIGFYLAFIM